MARKRKSRPTHDAYLSVHAWAFAAAFEARLAEELSTLGLSVAGFRLVGELMRAPAGLRTGELARRLGVKPPSVTTVVARLVELGVVDAVGDPKDARATLVRLTDDAPLEPGLAVFERLDRRLLAGVSARRRRDLASALSTLLANLQESP